MEVKVSHAAHEKTSDYQIECAPEHVDRWRRVSLAERGSEGCREPTPGHAVREVRHRVHEKNTPEEVSDVSMPLHDSPCYFNGTSQRPRKDYRTAHSTIARLKL